MSNSLGTHDESRQPPRDQASRRIAHDQHSDAPRTAVPPESSDPGRDAERLAPDDSVSGSRPVALAEFELRSADLKEGDVVAGAQVFRGMGCAGENISPELAWSNAPAGTRSFAVTLYDPDAPTGSGWWHWVMYNIPATVNRLPAGAGDPTRNWMPGVTQGLTDFGVRGYGGPCPPPGDPAHHYVFTVHALDVERLDLPDNATAAMVGFNLHARRLDSATLTGVYAR